MVAEVQNNLERIIDACREMQVKSLHLVGSGARVTDFTPESDLDFMYTLFPRELNTKQKGLDHFDFLWKLEEITGKKVDLIAEERIRNKYLLRSLMEDRVKIYEA